MFSSVFPLPGKVERRGYLQEAMPQAIEHDLGRHDHQLLCSKLARPVAGPVVVHACLPHIAACFQACVLPQDVGLLHQPISYSKLGVLVSRLKITWSFDLENLKAMFLMTGAL